MYGLEWENATRNWEIIRLRLIVSDEVSFSSLRLRTSLTTRPLVVVKEDLTNLDAKMQLAKCYELDGNQAKAWALISEGD